MALFTPRIAILLTFFAFGVMVGSNVGAFPILIKQASVSPFAFGIMGGLGMLANIIAMSIGGWINRHFDHRSVILTVLPMAFLAMCYTLIVGSLLSYAVSVIVFSYMLGTTDLFMNAEGAAVEQELGKPVFSSYHGMASLGMALFAIISSLISTWYGPLFVVLPALAPVIMAWMAVFQTIPHRELEKHKDVPQKIILPRKILAFIGIAAGLHVSCELAAIQWAGQLLTQIAPQFAAYSGLGLAFYGLCGGTMRMFGDRLRARFGDMRLMIVSLSVAIVGFFALSLAPGFWISVIAFAAVGCGLGIIFPCLFSFAGKLVPDAKAAAMAFVITVGGFPRVVFPWLLGWLAQNYSLSAVFAACVVVASTALVIIVGTFAKADAAVVKP